MSVFGDIFKKKTSDNGIGVPGAANPENKTGYNSGMPAGANVSQPKPISQPIDPDEFFARPERKPKKPKVEEAPEIDTSAIDPDQTLRAEGELPAVNYDYSRDKNKIETDNIDPDQTLRAEGQIVSENIAFQGRGVETDNIDPNQYLRGEGEAPAVNYDYSQDRNQIETDSIDPNQYLRGEGEAPAVNFDYSQDKNKIETDNIDPNQYLRGEGEAPAINYDFSKDNNSISTDGINTDTLQVWEQFVSAAAGSADSE